MEDPCDQGTTVPYLKLAPHKGHEPAAMSGRPPKVADKAPAGQETLLPRPKKKVMAMVKVRMRVTMTVMMMMMMMFVVVAMTILEAIMATRLLIFARPATC